jgi:hypothetical protein
MKDARAETDPLLLHRSGMRFSRGALSLRRDFFHTHPYDKETQGDEEA